jgi:hypothetical protein
MEHSMRDLLEVPRWTRELLALAAADALGDNVAAYLRAVENSTPNVAWTRERMKGALGAYDALCAANLLPTRNGHRCFEVHTWGAEQHVNFVVLDGAVSPSTMTFECCEKCGTIRVSVFSTAQYPEAPEPLSRSTATWVKEQYLP